MCSVGTRRIPKRKILIDNWQPRNVHKAHMGDVFEQPSGEVPSHGEVMGFLQMRAQCVSPRQCRHCSDDSCLYVEDSFGGM